MVRLQAQVSALYLEQAGQVESSMAGVASRARSPPRSPTSLRRVGRRESGGSSPSSGPTSLPASLQSLFPSPPSSLGSPPPPPPPSQARQLRRSKVFRHHGRLESPGLFSHATPPGPVGGAVRRAGQPDLPGDYRAPAPTLPLIPTLQHGRRVREPAS